MEVLGLPMSVYVDDMRAPFGRMIMCHMIADSTEELLTMADLIGVHRRWLQHPGTAREHFDVCLSMRKEAIAFGAIEVKYRQLAWMCYVRHHKGVLPVPSEAESLARDIRASLAAALEHDGVQPR